MSFVGNCHMAFVCDFHVVFVCNFDMIFVCDFHVVFACNFDMMIFVCNLLKLSPALGCASAILVKGQQTNLTNSNKIAPLMSLLLPLYVIILIPFLPNASF